MLIIKREKEPTQVRVGDLTPGNLFEYAGKFYMKMDQIEGFHFGSCAAVRLDTGVLSSFLPSTHAIQLNGILNVTRE